MGLTGVPGCAIAVVHDGHTLFAEGFGVADLRTRAPVTPDTTFQLASLSKPIGATAIAAHVTAGTVQWATPVRELLPEFSLGDPWLDDRVTIGDCYAHRTGLPDHAAEDLIDLGYDWRTAMSRLPLLPREPFRASYAYTNVALAIAGFAVADAAGIDWFTLSRESVYAPLGMARTTSSHAEFLAQSDRAVGHTDWGGTWTVFPDEYDTDVVAPAAGVSSSAADLAPWMSAIIAGGGRVASWVALSPALGWQSIRRRATTAAETDTGYGFGFSVGTTPDGFKQIGHSGVFSQGISTNAVMLPALGLGIVILTNGLPSGMVETIASEFLDRARGGPDHRTGDWWATHSELVSTALAQLDGSLTHEPPRASPAAPLALHDLAGRYENDYFGGAVVTVAGMSSLAITLGPRPAPAGIDNCWHAEHWYGDTFIVRDLHSPEVPPASTSAVTWDEDAGTMRFELFDRLSYGHGTFRRRAT